jgi:hypothetical protein
LRLESAAGVRAIAKWFVVALSAPAQSNYRSAREIVLSAISVIDLDFAFDPQ